MKKTAVVLIVGALVAWTGVAQGEPIWWTNENDGSTTFDLLDPAWGGNIGTTDGDIWSNGDQGKWTGPNLDPWGSGGTSTVELRIRYNDSATGEGLIGCFHPHQWQGIIQPSGGADDVLYLAGSGGGHFGMDEEWNIIRLLYNGNDTTVYLLPGGAMSGNGGAWTQDQIDNPLTTGWVGYGSGTTNFQLGGNIDVDYMRWVFDELVPVPEPATLALVGLGGLTALIRRKR